jgi:hypothetical protein
MSISLRPTGNSHLERTLFVVRHCRDRAAHAKVFPDLLSRRASDNQRVSMGYGVPNAVIRSQIRTSWARLRIIAAAASFSFSRCRFRPRQ